MADNYIGNRMDDYIAGKLKKASPRRLTPSGKRPGTLDLPVDSAATVWIPQGALLPAGRRLIELLTNSGVHVSYRAERGKTGAEPAIRSGARHYPPDVPAPETPEMTVSLTEGAITADGGRISIDYTDADALAAAAIAAAMLTEPGRQVHNAKFSFS